jgi:hypothetical protein
MTMKNQCLAVVFLAMLFSGLVYGEECVGTTKDGIYYGCGYESSHNLLIGGIRQIA